MHSHIDPIAPLCSVRVRILNCRRVIENCYDFENTNDTTIMEADDSTRQHLLNE